MNLKSVKIIAVDFDGTLCENSWPEIGEPNEELIEYLRNRKKDGDKLILWTCRVEDMLQKAVEWCKERNLVFDAVNENLPEIIENFGSDTRKIFANEYIDDRNIWPLKDDVTDVLYLCDGKSCGDTCPGVECKHTSDISHAKNFAKDAYSFRKRIGFMKERKTMGRAERRRAQKLKQKEKTTTYNLTKAQLDVMVREKIGDELIRVKQEATDDAVNTAMVLLLTLPLEVLMDHYWTKSYAKRIPKFTERVLEYYERWQNGELDMEKLKEDLWEYGGVKLVESEGEAT